MAMRGWLGATLDPTTGRWTAVAELTLVQQIIRAKLPAPILEHKGIPGRKFRFDLAWVDKKLALEIDGGIWTKGRHARGRHRLHADRARSGIHRHYRGARAVDRAALHGGRMTPAAPRDEAIGMRAELVALIATCQGERSRLQNALDAAQRYGASNVTLLATMRRTVLELDALLRASTQGVLDDEKEIPASADLSREERLPLVRDVPEVDSVGGTVTPDADAPSAPALADAMEEVLADLIKLRVSIREHEAALRTARAAQPVTVRHLTRLRDRLIKIAEADASEEHRDVFLSAAEALLELNQRRGPEVVGRTARAASPPQIEVELEFIRWAERIVSTAPSKAESQTEYEIVEALKSAFEQGRAASPPAENRK